MASKHKTKNLNKHKSKNCKKPYYLLKPYIKNKQTVRGGDFVFIAPDSNIIMRIAEMIDNRPIHIGEYNYLCSMLESCVFKHDGTINPKGKIVFVLLPEVKQELISPKYGTMRKFFEDFVSQRMIELKELQGSRQEYCLKTSPIAKEYLRQELFVQNGHISKDGFIAIRAAYCNLSLVTQDHHFGINNDGLLNKIYSANNRKIAGDHNGYPAKIYSLKNFMLAYRTGEKFSQPENLAFYDKNTQELIKSPKSKVLPDLVR